MSPVYHDTRVGRLMTEVDATLKCLWHGVCFPRDKRVKFADWWRGIVEASGGNIDSLTADNESRKQLLAEFISAGISRFENLATVLLLTAILADIYLPATARLPAIAIRPFLIVSIHVRPYVCACARVCVSVSA